MADKIPFDEDVMTLIMGVGDPEKPGQHGRTTVPMPEQKAIDLITNIRDMCDEFLQSADKEKDESKELSSESADDTVEEEE